MEQITALVVDDDPLARRAVCRALSDEDDISVVGEAADGASGIDVALETNPDVVVMDAVMPRVDGFAATRTLRSALPDTMVIMFTSLEDDDTGLLALRCGAVGYVPKTIDVGALPRIVRGVARGEAAVSRRLTRRLVESLCETEGDARPRGASAMTRREREVLEALERGARTREIAAELGVSVETIRSHARSLMRKLGAHSREEAVARAAPLLRNDGR